MATFEKRQSRGKTVWHAKVRRVGSKAQTATFRTKKAAEGWARDIEDSLARGKQPPSAQERQRTVGHLLIKYKREVLPRYGRKEQASRLSKLEYWNAQLGDLRLTQLTAGKISEVRERMATEGAVSDRTPKPATIARYLAAFKHAIQIAVREWEWIEDNPARRVRSPKEPRGRVRFLTADERDELLKACKVSKDPRLYPLVVTALGTGARQGELMNLRWKDVDLVAGVARLEETKNGERRTLSLNGPVLEELRKLKVGGVRRIDNDYVFASTRRGGVFFPKKPWLTAVEAAKLKDFKFHDCRHTFASHFAMSGATLAELADALGHKTLAMVRRYAHFSREHTSAKIAKMVEEFLG